MLQCSLSVSLVLQHMLKQTTHLSFASDWQVDILQLVSQLLVIEKVESYFGWNFDLRHPLLRFPLQGFLRVLSRLLRHRGILCFWWGVVNASINVSFQHTTSFEGPVADWTSSNICC